MTQIPYSTISHRRVVAAVNRPADGPFGGVEVVIIIGSHRG